MGRKKLWCEERTCKVCGASFMPEFFHQVYCCPLHARVARKAGASKKGRLMLCEDYKEAIRYYGGK